MSKKIEKFRREGCKVIDVSLTNSFLIYDKIFGISSYVRSPSSYMTKYSRISSYYASQANKMESIVMFSIPLFSRIALSKKCRWDISMLRMVCFVIFPKASPRNIMLRLKNNLLYTSNWDKLIAIQGC